MTTIQIAGRALGVDADGFLADASQWDRSVGEEIARANGIDLTERHWRVIEFMRDRYLQTGSAPTIRTLGRESGVPVKELYALFPRGPAKLAAKIGGIPKPHGCI